MLTKKHTVILFLAFSFLLLAKTNVAIAQSISTPQNEPAAKFSFYIPNAFTPNNDGINDVFFGKGEGIAQYDMWIFNRWGTMIFHGKELNDDWDGTINGSAEVAQQDVYVWKVRLTDIYNKKHDYIGSVTLVK